MRLLLDEMFTYTVAEQLRARGHDVVAVTERRDLERLPDPELVAAAQAEQRAIVTNNVDDFLALLGAYTEQGIGHYGLILTSDQRFPRSRQGFGRLVLALDAFLRSQPAEPAPMSLVRWLE